MAKFVITKTVSLGFLGSEYADSYIKLRTITMAEREELLKQLDKLGQDEKKSFDFVKETVLERFVSGQIDQDGKAVEIVKEDLMDLPSEVFLEAVAQLQGRSDPKS